MPKAGRTLTILAAWLGLAAGLGAQQKAAPEPAYISPNLDGVQDELRLPLRIRDQRYIVAWTLTVRDAGGKAVRTIKNKETRPETADFGNLVERFFRLKEGLKLPKVLVWDGRSDDGSFVPDGVYSYSLEAMDDNRNSARSDERTVVVATKAPTVAAYTVQSVFAPTGDRPQLPINQSCAPGDAPIASWEARLSDAAGKRVRSWAYQGSLPPQTVWDGKDDSGLLVPDGVYNFRLSTRDAAGNRAAVELGNLQVLNQATPIKLTVDNAWVSPNGDGIKDTVGVAVSGNDQVRVVNWVANLIGPGGQNFRSFRGSENLPRSLTLNFLDDKGRPLPEGKYRLALSALYINGNKSVGETPEITVDLTRPTAAATCDARVFSPNGDGFKDKAAIRQTASREESWEGQLTRGDGRDGPVVRSWTWRGLPDAELAWDGRDQSGQPVSDGYYAYQLKSTDQAGNSGWSAPLVLKVDNRIANVLVRALRPAFSPGTDSPFRTMEFALSENIKDGIESWRVRVLPPAGRDGKALQEWSGAGAPPAQLEWDGKSQGETAPDGDYLAELSVVYEKGDRPTSRSAPFALDTKKPEAELLCDNPQFSPDGDGVQDALLIRQKTSREEGWRGTVYNARGQAVRAFAWQGNAAAELAWNGADNAGNKLPDGDYSYELSARDAAGNTGSARLDGIRLVTAKPELTLSIDTPAFSPNGDGVKDEVAIVPRLRDAQGVKGWRFQIETTRGQSVRLATGVDSVPGKLFWDGKTEGGRMAPDGDYQAVLTVEYRSGATVGATSPKISLDTVPPSVSAYAEPTLFSPNGDGFKDSATIRQEASAEDLWTGAIRAADLSADSPGALVRSYLWVGKPPRTLVWDGSDSQGATVPDGRYYYQLSATDQAGNAAASAPVEIVVDNRPTPATLKVDRRWFSPGLALRPAKLNFAVGLAVGEGVESWSWSIVDAAGTVWRGQRGNSTPPAAFEWDGRSESGAAAPDGDYQATLLVVYLKGDQARAKSELFSIDTKPPQISAAAEDTVFSPEGDGLKDLLRIKQSSSQEELWEGDFFNAAGARVRSYYWKGAALNLAWDGRDDNGNRLPDGVYRYIVTAADKAGNVGRAEINGIVLDTRPTPLLLSIDRRGFAPGSGRPGLSSMGFKPVVGLADGAVSWSLRLVDVGAGGALRRSLGGYGPPPAAIGWDGTLEDGSPAPDGRYEAALTVEYRKGNRPVATSAGFVLNAGGPKLRLAAAPKPFSPDDDGENDEAVLAIGVDGLSPIKEWSLEIRDPRGAVFARFGGQGAPGARLLWNGRSDGGELAQSGMEYSATLSVVDALDNRASAVESVPVDLLVLRDGETLRIPVPGLAYAGDDPAPDAAALDADGRARNARLLDRLAELLRKFGSYQASVECHADAPRSFDSRAADRRNAVELAPLTERRAAALRDAIIRRGIAAGRLAAVGLGDARPVVPEGDAANAWKNRRAEIVLRK